MNYQDAKFFLDSFIDYEKVSAPKRTRFFKLERVNFLLEAIGSPHKKFDTVHVAGTKAKGSTCAFIYSVLKQAGFKAGLYISPHLIDFRERIVIDDRLISKKQLCDLVGYIKDIITKNKERLCELTFFELYTAIAFIYFAKQNVDIAVIETGLGGRFDATNVLSPLVCAITPVGYDHTDVLGKKLFQIAKEKAGIIKPQTPCVIAPQEKEALAVIKNTSKELSAPLYEVGKDLKFNIKNSSILGSTFDITGIFGQQYKNLKISLIGYHQVVNAAVATGIIELLKTKGLNINKKSIIQGLKKASWPGRLHILRKRPFVVLDGAQNKVSAAALKDSIKKLFSFNRLFLILGISKNKDIDGVGQALCPLADKVIFTKADNPRATSPLVLKRQLSRYCRMDEYADNLKDALQMTRQDAKQDDLILICGSLYLVGEAIRLRIGEKLQK